MSQCLHTKFDLVEHDQQTQGLIKEQSLIMQRIKRRNELLQLEAGNVKILIEQKQGEKQKILVAQEQLLSTLQNFAEEKKKFEEKLDTFKKRLDSYKKEETIFSDLQAKLIEATKQIIEIDPGTYLKTIKVGQFMETKIFAIYAILFHKIFSIHIKHPIDID